MPLLTVPRILAGWASTTFRVGSGATSTCHDRAMSSHQFQGEPPLPEAVGILKRAQLFWPTRAVKAQAFIGVEEPGQCDVKPRHTTGLLSMPPRASEAQPE